MHPQILAERKAKAQERLVKAAGALASAFSLPQELVDGLIPQTNNLQVKPLFELEAVTRLVEAVAEAAQQPTELEPVRVPLSVEINGPDGTVTVLPVEMEPVPAGETLVEEPKKFLKRTKAAKDGPTH